MSFAKQFGVSQSLSSNIHWLFRVLIILLVLPVGDVFSQNPYIRHITTADGLPSNRVYQVFQDSNNFIWFATDAGVARYDGSIFTYYRKNDGLSSNHIIRIKEDSQGRVWFFNLNARLDYIYEERIFNWHNTPYLDSLNVSSFFRDFYEDDNQTIYFYNNDKGVVFALDRHNQVFRYELYDNQSHDDPADSSSRKLLILHLSKSSDNEFLIWTRSGLFKTMELGGKMEKLSGAMIVNRVFDASFGSVYAEIAVAGRTPSKLFKYTQNELIDSMPSSALNGSFLTMSVFEDNEGLLWISTYDKGLFVLMDGIVVNHFDIGSSQSITCDHEGDFWISSLKEGVYKISKYCNAHEHFNNSLFSGQGIRGMFLHEPTGLWITNGKSFYLLKDSVLYESDYVDAAANYDQITFLNSNTLLLGEINNHLTVLKDVHTDAAKKRIAHLAHYKTDMLFKKFAVKDHGAEVSSFFGVYLLLNDQKNPENVKSFRFPHGTIYSTFYDTKGNLIVNSANNYRFENDSWSVCKDHQDLHGKSIVDYLQINEHAAFYNLESDSIFLLEDGSLYNLSALFDHMIDLPIRQIAFSDSILFLSTARNIYYCKNPFQAKEKVPLALYPIDFNFRDIHEILAHHQVIYIASDDGLTMIPFDDLFSMGSGSPLPYYKSVLVDDREININNIPIHMSGLNRLQIVFSGINYSMSPVEFSYMLVGVDQDWSYRPVNNVVYQNLRGGDYIFRLRARKSTSPWSDEVEMRFIVRDPLWKHPLFFLLVFLFLAGLFLLVLLWQKNTQLERRKSENQLILLEQKALQSMMNPHFIFNSLASIQNYLLQNKNEDAGLYLSRFARLIRQNLNTINAGMVPLDEEIDRLRNYLDLEQIRMEGKFKYQIEVDDDLNEDDIRIPSMIIQPFAENAIWHGISSLDSEGSISISFTGHSSKTIKISICDNGIGMVNAMASGKRNEKHLNMGMAMTRKRLYLLGEKMHIKSSLNIADAKPGEADPGTIVEMIVPISYTDEGF